MPRCGGIGDEKVGGRGRRTGLFHTTPQLGTTLPGFPLDSVGCPFQLTGNILDYRHHVSRRSGGVLVRDVTPQDGRRSGPSAHHVLPTLPALPGSRDGRAVPPQPQPVVHGLSDPAGAARRLIQSLNDPVALAARIVSWLTPKSAASERRLLVPARARIVDSCSGVSLRARARYRGGDHASRCDGHRGWSEGVGRKSRTGTRTVCRDKVLKVRIRSPSLPPSQP